MWLYMEGKEAVISNNPEVTSVIFQLRVISIVSGTVTDFLPGNGIFIPGLFDMTIFSSMK